MNRQRAQVFIATTHGLVQVQSIVPLNDPALNSVISVGSTSQLAGISREYQNFVAKPQGIINEMFNGTAYRLNLSQGIDQGESWQLGVFIAHYLFEHNCFSNGVLPKGSNKNDTLINDIIFVATGRVDTLHYTVLPIDELAKKCLYANPHIALWQAKQQQICFLAPSQNFRQPIPDSLMKLTPIAHLDELFNLCKLYGLATENLTFADTIDASASEKIENTANITEFDEAVTIEATLIEYEPNSNNSKAQIDAEPPNLLRPVLRRIPLILYMVIIATFIWSLVSLGSYLTNDGESSFEYIVFGTISENRANCLLADNILISQGVLSLSSRTNATNLNNLCELFVVTSQNINSLWLVSDTKAIININGTKISEETLEKLVHDLGPQLIMQSENLKRWTVPLPKNTSQTREFTLLAFLHAPDEADMSALERYLYQLHLQGKTHNKLDLQEWINKTQMNKKVFLLEQKLNIYP